MRLKLAKELQRRAEPERKRLQENLAQFLKTKGDFKKDEDLFLFKPMKHDPLTIEYDIIKDELMCGPVYLRTWIDSRYNSFVLNKELAPVVIPSLFYHIETLVSSIEKSQTRSETILDRRLGSEIFVVTSAHLKLLKTFNIQYRMNVHTLELIVMSWNLFFVKNGRSLGERERDSLKSLNNDINKENSGVPFKISVNSIPQKPEIKFELEDTRYLELIWDGTLNNILKLLLQIIRSNSEENVEDLKKNVTENFNKRKVY